MEQHKTLTAVMPFSMTASPQVDGPVVLAAAPRQAGMKQDAEQLQQVLRAPGPAGFVGI